MVKNSEFFFRIFSNQHTTRSYGYMSSKNDIFQKFDTCPTNGNFGAFLEEKHSKKTLGLNVIDLNLLW